MARVIVVEDDDTLLQTLRYNLQRAGHEVGICTNGSQAVDLIREQPPDLVVLDLMLPGLDGLEVCRTLRREPANPAVRRLPILMLTARDEEIDKVVGLELGADDYMTKPFSMHELLARVKALLRRAELSRAPEEPPAQLTAGDLVVDLAARRVTLAGVPLALKPREFDLLAYFLRHPDTVLTRDRLLHQVWGYEFAGDTRTVDVHVRWLRSKIDRGSAQPSRIQTVRGVGYAFSG